MHILLISPEIVDTHTRRFLQMLLDHGHFVTFVANDNPIPEGYAHFSFVKYPIVYISKRIKPRKLRTFLIEWGIALRLRQIWNQARPDIMHVIYINLRAYHCALAKLHPMILTALGSDINDLFEQENKDIQRRRKKIITALLAADHVTADTLCILKRCEILAGKPLKSSLFYFGIDLNLFKPRSADEKLILRQKLGIPQKSKVILSPRRLTPKMNHDLVLNAFAELMKGNLDAVLIFRRFGFLSGPLEIYLRNLAIDLGINDHVIWLDEIDYSQIPILYSLADLIINVPEQDGLPVTLFEASALMIPIITSDLPSYTEFLSGGAFCRIKVGDIDALVKAMQDGLSVDSSKDRSVDLQKNYDLVAQRADQATCFSVIEQIYKDLLG